MAGKPIDISGQRFGRLTAISYAGKSEWFCACDCGNTTRPRSYDLRNGISKSCGCLHSEIIAKQSAKHGYAGTRLYKTWCNMKSRCNTPSASKYEIYGGRGIKVCSEWLNFENFKDWALSNGYHHDLSIDRINSDGNYEPLNCRWTTYKIQGNNTRQNHILRYNGQEKTISEWADELGFSYKVLSERIRRNWTIERALTTPVNARCEA